MKITKKIKRAKTKQITTPFKKQDNNFYVDQCSLSIAKKLLTEEKHIE